MIVDELQSVGIKSVNDAIKYLSKKNQPLFLLPDLLTDTLAQLAYLINPVSTVVLNSNIGEISSKLNGIKDLVNLDADTNKTQIANYLLPNLNFKNTDPLTYSERHFDLVVCFPPLGQRINVEGRNQHAEILHVKKALNLSHDEGTVLLVLPSIFLSSYIHQNLRDSILEDFAVTKIIAFTKGLVPRTNIDFIIIELRKGETTDTNYYQVEPTQNFQNLIPKFSVPKRDLNERWDFSFHDPKNKTYQDDLIKYEFKKIEDLVDIKIGAVFTPEERQSRRSNKNFQIVRPRDISTGHIESRSDSNGTYEGDLTKREQNAILRKGDIVISRVILGDRIPFYVHQEDDNKYIVGYNLIILRGKNADYVATYLNTVDGFQLFNQQIQRYSKGSSIPSISAKDLGNIEIPILPIQDLQYASKTSLEKLSYDELIRIKGDYDSLKKKYHQLKKQTESSPHEQQLQSLQSTLDSVLNKVNQIDDKVSEVLSMVTNLTNEFHSIKSLPRDIDEKILRFYQAFDQQVASLTQEQDQLDKHIREIKNWFDYYDLLEVESQKYLPEAEYIFDKISELKNPDYSPFILQYCRAFENELLKKIFRAYVQSIVDRKIDIEKQFAWDFGKKDSGKPNDEKTFKLAEHIRKCQSKNKDAWFFELGTMQLNLKLLSGNTIKKSPLLQDLKKFVLQKFEKELLNIQYLDDIKTIITDYRNQSAHPNLMDTEKAMSFHKQMKECLVELMKNYKNKSTA